MRLNDKIKILAHASPLAGRVYDLLLAIPEGRVTTYGELALAAGRPGGARAIGQILKRNPLAPTVPCHRVVASDGLLGGYTGGLAKKIGLLKAEGVRIRQGKVANFKKIVYKF